MNRKINIIDFDTGRSLSITVDEEDILDTLLNKVKNYWVKPGDYVLAFSGELLAPVCTLKDYGIKDEDILQFRGRTSLEKREHRTLTPDRPEGIEYPKKCPNCGPVEFKYISSTEFQCLKCSGILHKQPNYKPVDPLDSFLPPGESFMDYTSDEETYEEENYMEDFGTASTPPPRIVPSRNDEMGNDVRLASFKKPPRIVGSSEKGVDNDYPETSVIDDEEDLPILIPEPSKPKLERCENCGSGMRFIKLYEMWWCDKCQKYLGEGEEGTDESTTGPDEECDSEQIPLQSTSSAGIHFEDEFPTGTRSAPMTADHLHPRPTNVLDETCRFPLGNRRDGGNLLPRSETGTGMSHRGDFQYREQAPYGGEGEQIPVFPRIPKSVGDPSMKDSEDGGPDDGSMIIPVRQILDKYKESALSRNSKKSVERDSGPLTEDIDNEFLIHRGREWLIEFMKMTNPIKTRSKWKDDNLQIEYRDNKDRLCVLEIDRSGEEIKPLFYRSSAYRKHGSGSDESDTF